MATRTRMGQVEKKSSFEIPKDGDLIQVFYEDRRIGWFENLIYHTNFEDTVHGKIEGACIFSNYWGNTGLALPFERLEAWRLWEGPFEDTKKWFEPNDSRIGDFSKVKVGPAFKPKPVYGEWIRPNDGEYCSVRAGSHGEDQRGIYDHVFDRLCHQDGFPTIPFADWIDYRAYDPHDFASFVDWILGKESNMSEAPVRQMGPKFEEWSREETARRIQSARKSNEKLLTDSQNEVRHMLNAESVPQVRLERLYDLLKESWGTGFIKSSDPDGQGEFFYDCYIDFLEKEFRLLERALHIPIRGFPVTPLYEAMTGPEAPTFERVLLMKARHFKITDEDLKEIFLKLHEEGNRRSLESKTKQSKRTTEQTSEILDSDEPNEHIGPCNYTAAHLAQLVGMSHSGVCGALKQGRKIRDVRVKYTRNEGERAPYQISDKSYRMIERKLKSKE